MKKTTKMGLGLVVMGLALTGCQDNKEQTAAEMKAKELSWPTTTLGCTMVLPDADTQADAGTSITAIYGPTNYDQGIWTVAETGAIIGFSQYEDAIIWPTAECAANGPNYMTD